MKIGIFSDAYIPDINGVVTSILTLQTELEKHGHSVYIVTTHPKLMETKVEDKIMRLPGIELKQLYGYVMSSPVHIKALDIIREWELDIVHAHTEFGVGIFARIVSKTLKLPLVSTYHTMYEDYTHYVNFLRSDTVDKIARVTVANLSKLYADSSTEIIAPSEKTKETLLRYGVKHKINVIPTGMDLKRFSPANTTAEEREKIRAECQVQPDETAVIFVGRIAQEKSIDFLIEAMSCLKDDKCKLLIVGDGPQLEELQKLSKNLKVEKRVYFVGRVAMSEVPKYYHAADIFSSVSLTETQGMTFIEALAAGLPVIARPDEILDEVITENENGYYINTPQEWAERVKRFHQTSAAERKLLQKKALESAWGYDSELFYERVLEVYKSAIDEYSTAYTVTAVQYKNDVVDLTLENAVSKQKVSLTVEAFSKYGLRKDSKVEHTLLGVLREEEKYAKANAKAMQRIAQKDRSRKEMYDWLTKNSELSIEQINNIIDSLEDKGYIDDKRLVKSQIQNLRSLLQGKSKIIKNLQKRGITIEMIDEAFVEEEDIEGELSRAINYAEKIQQSTRDKSVRAKIDKIRKRLFAQGFSNDIINSAINELNFIKDENREYDLLRKHAIKAQKRYENKYEKSELRNRVYRYLAAQGFDYDDIYIVLNEMEWNDE